MINRLYSTVHPLTRNPFLAIGAITILGTILRIYFVGNRSLWLDEAQLYWIAQGTFEEVLSKNAIMNSSPPLFALIVSLISKLGESEVVLRSISIVFGILSIPFMFVFAKFFLGLYPAYLSSLLVAVSLTQIRYSLELREYSLTVLVAILMFMTYYKFLHQPNWINWLLLTISLVFGIFAQYGLALLAISLNFILIIFLLINSFQRRGNLILIIRWTLAQIFVLVAVLIVYNLSLREQFVSGGFGSNSYLQDAYWNGSFSSLIKLGILNSHEIFDFTYPHSSLLLFFCAIGVLYALRNRKLWIVVLFLAFPMMVTFMAALLRLYPYYGGRQLIFLSPMIFLFVGIGFEYFLNLKYEKDVIINHQILALLAFIIFTVTGIKYTLSYYLLDGVYIRGDVIEEIKPLVNIINESLEPNDRIYIGCAAGPAFRYYYRRNQNRWISKGEKTLEESYDQLEEILNVPGRFWMIFSHCTIENEHKLMVEHASHKRDVELMSARRGAWLYLAKDLLP